MGGYLNTDRWLTKVDKKGPGGCWLWTGRLEHSGYGIVSLHGQRHTVHNAFLRLTVGPPPPGKPFAVHSCRNRHCVNPKHLSWGSRSKNNGADRRRDGTLPLGIANGKSKWTDDEIRAIYLDSRSPPEISKAYGISTGYIWKVKQRQFRREATEGL